jgi:threonine synthase
LKYPVTEIRYHCNCGSLLTVERDPAHLKDLKAALPKRNASFAPLDVSGVWKFREAVLDLDPRYVVTHPEGRTRLYARDALSAYGGVDQLRFKHEGENPTGSFKDRGMTVAVSQAMRLGAKTIACASTGNTSAALAAYAAQAGLKAVVFIPAGKVAAGKLAQAVGYGAECLSIRGDFDEAMRLVQESAKKLGMYLVNSLNPFRLEGQKTIIWEILEELAFKAPDWIVVPGGNLGNTSAFGKALAEAHAAGWIDRLPRIASIQAQGANPFYRSYKENFATRHKVKAETVATAIRIGDPVNYDKAKLVIESTKGLVSAVDDQEIMAAKAAIDRSGIGCEPASACTLAGVKRLVKEGAIQKTDSVVCILTGHMLKDPDAVIAQGVKLKEVDATIQAVEKALAGR